MKILTWNTAGRTNKIKSQIIAITKYDADIVCLQEIQQSGDFIWQAELSKLFPFVTSSLNFIENRSKTGSRKFHQIIASKLPINVKRDMSKYVPWEERLLVVYCPSINIHIATTHIPPGVSNGWLKIDFFEGLFNMLSKHKVILAGDFNSPRKENQNGTLITWGQKISKHGKPYIPKLILGQPGQRWHEAEYNLLKGITQIGYSDFYRSKNGYIDSAYSWKTPSNKEIRYRFDHIIGPSETKICNASYLMEFIENKLSDHTALLVDLQLGVN